MPIGRIRSAILDEQKLGVVNESYCAYSEAYLRPIDSANIEHFDDRKKDSEQDNYWNWYAVLGYMNFKKPTISKHLPVLCPYDPSLPERITYDRGQFFAVDSNDTEAVNLIEFLGWNDPTLADYRRKHVARMRANRELFDSDADFIAFMRNNPENLGFITALEAELEIAISQ